MRWGVSCPGSKTQDNGTDQGWGHHGDQVRDKETLAALRKGGWGGEGRWGEEKTEVWKEWGGKRYGNETRGIYIPPSS